MLAGGEGTRLRPLTYTVPKQLLPVAGVTMLERVLGRLAAHGIDDVVLSMGYRPDAFREQFPDGRAAGVALTYAVEPEPRDTAGAIRFAADEAGIDGTFVVLNGDVLTDLDLGALVAFHRERGGLATIALTPVEDPSAFGVVPTDSEGRVTAFIEKPPRDLAPTNLINAGTYVLEPEVLAMIPPGARVSIERETFPALVGEGRLFAMASDAYWLDTGTPAQYLRANLDLVEGPALLEPGSSVAPTARVCRSVVGAGARVEEGAEVRDSVLLPDAVVGPGAVVDGSIVGARARIGAHARLGPVTVVGCDVEVPAGRVLQDERVPA